MSKAKRWHGIGDESRKGGASMFLTGAKGEFETPDGLESHNALLDVKFVLNQVTSGCCGGCLCERGGGKGWGSFVVNAFTNISLSLVFVKFIQLIFAV